MSEISLAVKLFVETCELVGALCFGGITYVASEIEPKG